MLRRKPNLVKRFLAAFPALRAGWKDYLARKTVEHTDADDRAQLGKYLLRCFERGDLEEYQTGMALLEQFIIDVRCDVKRSMECLSVLHPIFLRVKNEPTRAAVEAELRPYTRAIWEGCELLTREFQKAFAENPLPGDRQNTSAPSDKH